MSTHPRAHTDVLTGRLSADAIQLLRRIGQVACEMGMQAYLVGGPVRDALLARPVLDMDVTVEGDATVLAQAVGREVAARRVVIHSPFGTARVDLPGGGHVDLATARSETYPAPGALPEVAPADIITDLRRRDFSVNAMAACLRPSRFGELLDPVGGYRDLRRGVLRALHPGSFTDDPTRMIRAAAYAERFALALDPETEQWLQQAIARGALGTVSPARAGEQLRRGLETVYAGRVLLRLAEWGVAEQMGLPPSAPWPHALADVRWGRRPLDVSLAELGQAAFALAAGTHGPDAAEGLKLGRHWRRVCEEFVRAMDSGFVQEIACVDSVGQLDALLHSLQPATVLALWAMTTPSGRRAIEEWRRATRSFKLLIRGEDLLRAGVPAGPAINVGLRAARRRALDGEARDAQSQLRAAVAAAMQALDEQHKADEHPRSCGGHGKHA